VPEDLAAELAVPEDLPRWRLPIHRLSEGTALYRVQPAHHASGLFFGRSGLNRWDCPGSEPDPYGVLYAGLSARCALYETVGHPIGKQIFSDRELAEQRLWEIQLSEPLPVVDLTGSGLAQLRLDLRLTATRDLAIPQRWSHAFHIHPEQPAGIRYVSRHHSGLDCIALFERVSHMLDTVRSQDLLLWQDPRSGETAVDYILERGGEVIIEGRL
jgi:hypothetical protein